MSENDIMKYIFTVSHPGCHSYQINILSKLHNSHYSFIMSQATLVLYLEYVINLKHYDYITMS